MNYVERLARYKWLVSGQDNDSNPECSTGEVDNIVSGEEHFFAGSTIANASCCCTV